MPPRNASGRADRPAAAARTPHPPPESPGQIADRMHSAAIHLLRRLRREDSRTGVSAPRLSALSVIVFAGPITLGDLAAAEQVRPPTMTRLVDALEAQGLVVRDADPHDGRITRVRATQKGRTLLARGRARRVEALTRCVETLPSAERERLAEAIPIVERLIAALDRA